MLNTGRVKENLEWKIEDKGKAVILIGLIYHELMGITKKDIKEKSQ